MPNIYVEGPPVEVDKKRTLAKEITEAAVKAYGIPQQAMVVIIRENPAENVSVGGCLLCDMRSDETD
ncbi:MAG TPA: 4-oxalocrotonate tautomerase DmpI [Candidatus Anoxymicrobiaceae bacterium]